jgi:sec-independent protein translocase protein TatA
MGIESPLHLLFIGAVALLVLGPRRLPEVARALGKGLREFREAMGEQPAPRPAPVADSASAATQPAGSPHPPAGHGGVYDLQPIQADVDPAEPVPSAGAPDRRPL